MRYFTAEKLTFFVLFISIFFSGYTVNAQTSQKYCDSLITEGQKSSNAGEYLKAVELYTKALHIAKNNNWNKQLFSANNDMGASYFALLDYGTAIKYYSEAYNIAVKYNMKDEEIRALNNIAILYTRKNDFTKAQEYFKKIYGISKQRKDSLAIGIYAFNLGLVLNDTKQFKQSRIYLDESFRYSLKSKKLNLAVRTAITENEMEIGSRKKAIAMAKVLLTEIPDKSNPNAVTLFLIMAKCYKKDKDFTKAVYNVQMALANNDPADLDTKQTIYEMFTDIYTESGQLAKALISKDSIYAIQNKLHDINNGKEFENNSVKFEIQDYKNQISLNEATITQERRLFYFVLGSMAVLLLLIFFIFRNLSMKHKQKKLIAENNQQLLALELVQKESESLLQEKKFREEQHEILLEQERLKNEIEYKNRQLSSKALYTSGKYQMIEEVIGLLSDQPEVAEIPAVTKHIRYLRNSLNTTDEWETFLTHFEEVNQGFLSRLKSVHTNLTANDIRFICYVYMNLNAKEIATMLNISLDAGRKRKERIAQKIGLEDSTSLYAYLSGI